MWESESVRKEIVREKEFGSLFNKCGSSEIFGSEKSKIPTIDDTRRFHTSGSPTREDARRITPALSPLLPKDSHAFFTRLSILASQLLPSLVLTSEARWLISGISMSELASFLLAFSTSNTR